MARQTQERSDSSPSDSGVSESELGRRGEGKELRISIGAYLRGGFWPSCPEERGPFAHDGTKRRSALIHVHGVRDARKPTLQRGRKKKRVAHNGSEPSLLRLYPAFPGAPPPSTFYTGGCRVCTRVPLGISEIYIPVRPIVGRRMAGIS